MNKEPPLTNPPERRREKLKGYCANRLESGRLKRSESVQYNFEIDKKLKGERHFKCQWVIRIGEADELAQA